MSKTYFRVPYLKWLYGKGWGIRRVDGNLRAIWRHQINQFRLWRRAAGRDNA